MRLRTLVMITIMCLTAILPMQSQGDEPVNDKPRDKKTRSNMWRLWKTSIAAPVEPEKIEKAEKPATKNAGDTKKVEQPKSHVEKTQASGDDKAVTPKKTSSTPAAKATNKTATTVSKTSSADSATKSPNQPVATPANADGLDPLRKLLSKKDIELVISARDISDPVRFADKLYAKSQPAAAAVFYRFALEKLDSKKIDDPAWVYLQLGNCLRSTDPVIAREKYMVVMTQYSESSWFKLAQMQEKYLQWWLTNRPDQIVGGE